MRTAPVSQFRDSEKNQQDAAHDQHVLVRRETRVGTTAVYDSSAQLPSAWRRRNRRIVTADRVGYTQFPARREATMDGGVWQALGVVPYPIGLAIQRQLADERAAGLRSDTLLLLEHPPTITLGRRAGQEDVLWGVERLAGAGIVVERVGRGGRATYHGPGQLIGYAIARLSSHGRGVRRFVSQMEAVLLDVAQSFRRDGFACVQVTPGLWVGDRKLASIGIEVRSGISRHGFALNVDVDLRPFAAIVPCGIPGLEITDLTREAGSRITVEVAALRVLAAWRRRFGEIVEEAANGLDAAG